LNKFISYLWLASVFLLSLGGVAAFIYLFVLEYNVFWLILSPIIFSLYQLPAVYLFWLWKKQRKKGQDK